MRFRGTQFELIVSRRLRNLFFCCIFAPTLATGQPASPQPARIVTEYALTSAWSTEFPDPKNWKLLGSNDGVKSWELLDVQTNQIFTARSERRVYSITNRAAYSTYRLRINGVARVQLAELELIGPVVGMTNETDLQAIITSSGEHPLIGPAMQVFDNDPTTKWLGYGLGRPMVCWIQCEYTTQSGVLVTNVSQYLLLARRAAMRNPL